ncbi:response regulator [Flavobacterium sp.]|uniref:response regulator n=1 Tax=Flavobacterium sp. TaxID=239 RepID=UPI00248A18F8|nr:response regulator [Flavobacterium sp.]MDI1317737.1 response regulator [Flavobacterium sp.]
MNRLLNILFIDDDVIEVMKFNRVLDKLNLNHKVIEANNAKEALSILKNKDIIPDLIILDLKMPEINGVEFLRIVKNDDGLKRIPLVVFTTSNDLHDILKCYEIGVSGYMLKHLKYEDYEIIVEKTLNYWSCNELT